MLLFKLCIYFLVIACFENVAFGGTGSGKRRSRRSENVCKKNVCARVSNRLQSNLNISVDPCQDFYSFSCGNWIKNNPVPNERTWWSPWAKARVDIKKDVQKLLEQPYNPKVHRFKSAKKILDFYQSCTDIKTRNKVGIGPLLDLLRKIGGWPMITKNWSDANYDWENVYVYLRSQLNVKYLIDLYVDTDTIEKTKRVIYLDRPTFGVGNSELGILTDSNGSDRLIKAYKKYMKDVVLSLNHENVEESVIDNDIEELFDFVQQLTRIVTPADEKKDHFAVYQRMTLDELDTKHHGVNWKYLIKNIFKTAKVRIYDDEEIIVEDKSYIAKLAGVLRKTTNRIVANYFAWRVALHFSDYTNSLYTKLYFEFQRTSEGLRVQEQLWEFCYALLETYYPSAVGRLYIDNYFNSETIEEVEELIDLVRDQVDLTISNQNWMDKKTRRHAKEKLNNMYPLVAYQYWLTNNSYMDFLLKDFKQVNTKKFFNNVLKLQKIEAFKGLEKLRLPVNRLKLINLYGPATVNAYNYFDQNIIQFPAGILQEPFFNLGAPASVNFGAIGKTIGHEMIHSYDDEGKQYDENGSLRDWWTTKTEKKYTRKAECFIHQYNKYKDATTGLSVNGFNTEGENIADNGGLSVAFRAYKKYINNHGKAKDQRLPGYMKRFTGEQLFFISFASIWCENETKESLVNTLLSEAHSPSKFRVIGTVSNLKDFATAFNCPLSSPMNPKNKCLLW